MNATLQGIKQRFGIIGKSKALNHALSTAMRVAKTDLSVLIEGESGVGKEVFSKIIHELSSRKHNKFIAINCGAIPEGTINSELFGHEKGAYTGATGERQGYFETVNGGTIFLDEIGEMPLDTQAYLLRVLESGEFMRVGSSQVKKTDVRVIAATNAGLKEKIKEKKFREDLYYRISTVPIKVPALYERVEDIYLLFRKFAVDFAEKYRMPPISLDERGRMLLESYRWPGNVRELKNLVEHLSIMTDERPVTVETLVDIAPHLLQRHLPATIENNSPKGDFRERELMLKFLLEMKTDLNDLKSLVFELINTNNLNVPNLHRLNEGSKELEQYIQGNYNSIEIPSVRADGFDKVHERPIILSHNEKLSYDQTEIVEENLSLEAMEKEMISKALKKYNGRRKEASEELGISERTLYRKIKQYELDEK